jgi:hypothetical protein
MFEDIPVCRLRVTSQALAERQHVRWRRLSGDGSASGTQGNGDQNDRIGLYGGGGIPPSIE